VRLGRRNTAGRAGAADLLSVFGTRLWAEKNMRESDGGKTSEQALTLKLKQVVRLLSSRSFRVDSRLEIGLTMQ
jgi:hypothetical protein